MVIQRWQSVLLLLAGIVMGLFCLSPLAVTSAQDVETTQVFIKDIPVVLTVSILVAVILLLSIFMYKNLKKQMKITLLSIVLICVVLVAGIFVVYVAYPGYKIEVTGALMVLVISLILAVGAYRLMGKDLKKLRSYDRLR